MWYKNNILFVDDEINVLNSIKRAVVDESFKPLFASSGEEALELLGKNEISILVTDMRMPGMDGLALLKEAKVLYPDTLRIVLSGYALLSLDQVLVAINQGDIYRFITKPWRMEEDLLSVLRQGVEYYNLRREKKNLELSLQQKNAAYKKMLRIMEEKSSNMGDKLKRLEKFFNTIFESLEKELSKPDLSNHKKISTNLKIVRKFTADYFKTMPTLLTEFALTDIAAELNEYVSQNHSALRYKEKINQDSIHVLGNQKLVMMILFAVVDLICWSGDDRKINYLMSSEMYQEKGILRMSNVLEFGYVDGATVLIDAEEVLTYDNLDYYIGLLAQMGLPYGIVVTYTYVNQNTSVISVVAELLLA